VRMGCKQNVACENNKKHNFFKGSGITHANDQCNPTGAKNSQSVCRQCCNADKDCGKTFLSLGANNRADWDNAL